MRERRLVGFGLLALFAVSCSTGSPSGSTIPGASVAPAESECSSFDIVSPSGTRVELTGIWRSDDGGVYDITQRGSCVFWLGRSQDLGSGSGLDWTNVFTGSIGSDLKIVGRWGDVLFSPTVSNEDLSHGMLELRIDFSGTGEEEHPVLRRVAESGFFGGSTWVLEESLSAPVDLEGTFGGDEEDECLWVEADGRRFELIGSGGWTFRSPPLSIQDRLGNILARVGDPILVHGLESAVLGSGCTDTGILVEALDPTP